MSTSVSFDSAAQFSLPTDTGAYTSRWKAALSEAKATISSLEQLDPSQVTSTGHQPVLKPLNHFALLYDAHISEAVLFRAVHPSKEIRDGAEQAEQAFKKLRDEVTLSLPIYKLVSAVDQGALGEAGNGETDTLFWVKHLVRDYRREGIDRDASTRDKVKDLKREITEIGQAFDRNISEDARTVQVPSSALEGLPEDYIAKHEAKDGMVTISTDYPDYVPFMQYARDGEARKKLFFTNLQRAYPKNAKVMLEMFRKRQELASLLGYPTYADYRLETEMVESGDKAQSFIDRIDSLAMERAGKDHAEMLKYKLELDPTLPADSKVYAYDARYLEQGLKKTKYNFDSQEARQYFPFGRVRDGIMDSMAELFGIRFKMVDSDAWHTDVVAYELYTIEDGGDKLSGRFFLDLHPRDNKYKHAAEFPIRTGTMSQLPEAALVCNFPSGEESLMEHSDVTTFFHEFGHLLHQLFSPQRWVALGGIACDFDFIEAPSQMLEQWAFDAATLKRFAINDRGEVLPDEIIAALKKSRGQGRGLLVRQQMYYAALSLNYHSATSLLTDEKALDSMSEAMQTRYGPYESVPDTHFACSFGHLKGYSAGYYSYMWSQVIAQDLFTRFQEKGLYDETVAKEYKGNVLAKGGSEDAGEFVKRFLGREYGFEAFGRYLEEGQ